MEPLAEFYIEPIEEESPLIPEIGNVIMNTPLTEVAGFKNNLSLQEHQ